MGIGSMVWGGIYWGYGLGIRDWASGLGNKIGHWGLGLRIRDYDLHLSLGMGINILDFDVGLGLWIQIVKWN